MIRRILSIDGGGIKGVFPASFLASLEQTLGRSIIEYFDLIAGTSTGGIIALGLGLGLSAEELVKFYETYGPSIFGGNRSFAWLRSYFRAKYNPAPLKSALVNVFGDHRLGESKRRLIVPSLNIDTGEVHVWKTPHHPRFERDYRHSMVEVALSTGAAPTYFPTYRSSSGAPLIDGGVWANNPIAIATVEAMGVLEWHPADLRILSLGCTTAPLQIDWGRHQSLGKFGWADKIADVMMTAQSFSAYGMVQHLLPDRNNCVRISPTVGKNQFELDGVEEMPSLRGMGDFEARKALPALRPMFFESTITNDYVPLHKI